MHAMVLNRIGKPLEWTELPDREPEAGQIRVTEARCRPSVHAPRSRLVRGSSIVNDEKACAQHGCVIRIAT